MSIKIGFTFDTAAEAAEFLLYVEDRVKAPEPRPFEREKPAVVEAAPKPEPEAEKSKKAAKSKTKAKDEPEAPPAPIAIADLRKALGAVLAAKGEPACNVILKMHGVTRIGEVDTKQYAAFVADCNAAL